MYGGGGEYVGNIKISFKAPPADHVNSKWPPLHYSTFTWWPPHLISPLICSTKCNILACVADALCIEHSRISAQCRVRIPQSGKDICRCFWLASFLRSLWLVRLELSVDKTNTTNSSWQERLSLWYCETWPRVSLNNRGFSCSLFV